MKYTKPKGKRKPAKRSGRTTKDEKEVVKAVVRQSGGDVPIDKTKMLAKVFNRPVATVKALIADAKNNLAADAAFYVDTHRQAVDTAMQAGQATLSPKLLDVARRGAEWALENISGDGKRIVEKAEAGPQGMRIMLGVKLSNTTMQPEAVIDISADAVEGETIDGPS